MRPIRSYSSISPRSAEHLAQSLHFDGIAEIRAGAMGFDVVNFFRGNFCEFCQLELKALQRSYHEFQKYNATLVGISPSFVSIKTPGDKNLTPYSYSILTDVGNKVAAAYGLRYKISEELENILIAMGVDTNSMYDEDGENTLSIPATFVVRSDRKIIFKFADTDYTKRAEPADIIASLISISEQ